MPFNFNIIKTILVINTVDVKTQIAQTLDTKNIALVSDIVTYYVYIALSNMGYPIELLDLKITIGTKNILDTSIIGQDITDAVSRVMLNLKYINFEGADVNIKHIGNDIHITIISEKGR